MSCTEWAMRHLIGGLLYIQTMPHTTGTRLFMSDF